jgi:NTE family protein
MHLIKSPFWRHFSPPPPRLPAWAELRLHVLRPVRLALKIGVKIIDFLRYSSFAVASQFLIFLFLIAAAGCCPRAYVPQAVADPLPSFYVPQHIRVALVLGGGGVRGMAHVGVLEELEAAGVPIDLIVGCSAGSIVGALYAENPCVANIREAVWNLRVDTILDIDFWTCRYGLSQGKSFHKVLDDYLNAETFEQLQIPLVVVATDLYSGELVPMGGGDLVKSVQASCSIPFVFVPCDYMGRILVDGGVVNPVPVKVARDLGADVIIAVDLSELLPKTFPKNLFQIADRSAEIIFTWQNEVCTRTADVIIRPETCGAGAFNEKMKMEIYHAGKRAAQNKIPKILETLAERGIYGPLQDPCQYRQRLVQMKCYTPQIWKDEKEEE